MTPDQKPSTMNPLTTEPTNQKRRPLMTRMKRPSVSTVTGSVSRIRTGRMNAFTSPRISAAMSALLKSAIVIDGMRYATAISASVLRSHTSSILIALSCVVSQTGSAAGSTLCMPPFGGSGRLFGDFDHLLADILAREQSQKSTRQTLEAVGDVELRFHEAPLEPCADALARLCVVLLIVAHEETFDRGTRDQDLTLKARADIGLAEAGGETDATDERDAGVRRQVLHDRLVDRTGRVVDEHIDPLRTHFAQRGGEVTFRTVVDHPVVAHFAAPRDL